jgi:hypothetical protein
MQNRNDPEVDRTKSKKQLENIFMKNILLRSLVILLMTGYFSGYGHWTSKGPYGGHIKCMAASDTLLFIGTYHGGVYRSTNSYVTSWKYANYTGLSNGTINALLCFGNKVIAGTPSGAFRSKDIGTTWTSQNSGLNNLNILCLAKFNQFVFAGTSNGVFISTDTAATWNPSAMAGQTITCFAQSNNTLFAGTANAGIFQSTDNGTTWQALNNNLNDLSIISLVNSGNDLIAATPSGVYTSNIMVPSWINLNTGLNSSVVNCFYNSGANIYAATTHGAYLLNGLSWSAANTGYADTLNSIITFNNKLYAGSRNDGIVRSTSISAASWMTLNTGLNNLEINAIHNSGQLVIAATNKGLFVSRDLAATYIVCNSGIPDSLNITSLAFSGTKLYISTKNSGVFCSADTGKTWSSINAGIGSMSIKKISVYGSVIFAAGFNDDVYYSDINNLSWSTSTGLPSGIVITSFAAQGNFFVLGSSTHGVFTSTNLATWNQTNAGLANANISSLAIYNNEIYAGTIGSGIFKSALPNVTWNNSSSGLPTQTITSLFAGPNGLIAGFKGGVSVSGNGINWNPPNVFLYIPEFSEINDISYESSSTRIFISTPHNSLYSNNVAELPIGMQEILGNLSSSIYPNPSNGQVNIQLNVPETNTVRVKVLTLYGKVIQEDLLEEPGSYQIKAPAGIYFLQLETPQNRFVHKIILE